MKYILIAFAVMAFAFYELSGGENFVSIADEKRAALAVELEKQRLAEAAAKAEREAELVAKAQEAPAPAVNAASVNVANAPVTTTAFFASQTETTSQAEAFAAAVEEAIGTAVVEDEVAPKDIREVTAARVNMRGGPGQSFDILAKLTSGAKVEILQDNGDGWVKLEVIETGRVGWMADFLLTASN